MQAPIARRCHNTDSWKTRLTFLTLQMYNPHRAFVAHFAKFSRATTNKHILGEHACMYFIPCHIAAVVEWNKMKEFCYVAISIFCTSVSKEA